MRWVKASEKCRDFRDAFLSEDYIDSDDEDEKFTEGMEKIKSEAREKYQIPYGVILFHEEQGMAETIDKAEFMKFAKWWVKGEMTDQIFEYFCSYFDNMAEIDYYWVLMEQPAYFFPWEWPEHTNEPTFEELEPELKQIGTRSKKKAWMSFEPKRRARDEEDEDEDEPVLEPKEQPKEEPRYITAEDICTMFSIGLRTVKRMQSNGILKAHKLGPHMVRFRADEVEASIFSR